VRPRFLNRIDKTIMFETIRQRCDPKIWSISNGEKSEKTSEAISKSIATKESLDYLGEVDLMANFGAETNSSELCKRLVE